MKLAAYLPTIAKSVRISSALYATQHEISFVLIGLVFCTCNQELYTLFFDGDVLLEEPDDLRKALMLLLPSFGVPFLILQDSMCFSLLYLFNPVL